MLNIDAYGTLTNNDIIALEQKIGLQLPVDYRDFLATTNGGRVIDSVYHVDVHCAPEAGPLFE